MPITVQMVIALHDRILYETGGVQGIRSDPAECIASAQNQTLYGSSKSFSEPVYFAVALFYCFARRHKFADGNKRTAWMSMVYILASFGLTLNVDDETAEDFVNAIASNLLTLDDAYEWISERKTKQG